MAFTKEDLLIARYSHLTYPEMAERLGVSPRSAKHLTDKLKRKLGVSKKRHIQDRCRELRIDYGGNND